MDLVLKLREARRMRGLSQKDAARLSGVGVKSISSFETGERIDSLKYSQLERLLTAYGLTPAEFFGSSIEKSMAPWELDENQVAMANIAEAVHALPKRMQRELLAKFQLMVDTIAAVYRGGYETDGIQAFPSAPASRGSQRVA